MLVKHHFIISFLASILIYLIFPLNLFQISLIFLSSIFIDIDHYLIYILIKKDFSLNRAHKWFLKKRVKWLKLSRQEKEKTKRIILFFHGFELIIFIGILSIFFSFFKFILIGILIHLFLDYVDIFIHKDKFYPKVSQIYLFFKNKNKQEIKI